MSTAGDDVLRLDGREVARIAPADALPAEHSPRPFLHPLRSPAGVVVTDLAPADHPWHAGLSLAVADVSGTNYWGGNTFVAGTGYVLLDDHGRVDLCGTARDGTGTGGAPAVPGPSWSADLRWRDRDGTVVLQERRHLDAAWRGQRAWQVTARSRVRNVSERDLEFGSPGTRGRPDAGYGGWTLRLAPQFVGARVCTSADPVGGGGLRADSGESGMGRAARWVCYRTGSVTVVVEVLVPADAPLPAWYVRVRSFPALGPAPFFRAVHVVPPGGTLDLGVRVVVADGDHDPAELLQRVPGGTSSGAGVAETVDR